MFIGNLFTDLLRNKISRVGESNENSRERAEIAALIELAGGELVMLEVKVENSGQVGRVLINTDVSIGPS